MTYTFQPRGVCSRAMTVEVDDQGVIRDLQVVGGCNGNRQGISALVKGMKAEEAIARLPERERLTIQLRYFHGMTQERPAKVLGVSQVLVSRLERRGLERLRHLLRP